MSLTEINENNQKQTQKVILNQSLVVKNPHWRIREEIIAANTFSNPKYIAAEMHGRSRWNIEEFVYTYKREGEDLVISRGFTRHLKDILNKRNIDCLLEDQRTCPSCEYAPLTGITLRPYQQQVVDTAASKDQGVLVAPTGAGKSIIGLELICRKQTPALILVHRKELAEQWRRLIAKVYGFEPAMIASGSWKVGKITIAMLPTLAKHEAECKEIAQYFGMVLVDETHHTPAETFAKVISWMPCKYRYGLSATPVRRDGLDALIFRSIGPILATVSKQDVEALGGVIPAKVIIVRTELDPGSLDSWHEYASWLDHSARNELVISLIQDSTLILTDRVSHAKQLSEMLTRRGIGHVLAHGELPTADRKTLMERIKQAKVTVGTTGLLGEGLDVAHWEVLVLASPISSEVKLMQAVGRIVRPSHGKEFATVFDLHDNHAFSGGSLKKRIAIYQKHSIRFEFAEYYERKAS